jgi:signal transduction histidine kinase
MSSGEAPNRPGESYGSLPELKVQRAAWRAQMLTGIRPITASLSALGLVTVLFLMGQGHALLPLLGFSFLLIASIVPGVSTRWRSWMIGIGIPVMCLCSIPKFGLAPNVFGGLVLSATCVKLLFDRRPAAWISTGIAVAVLAVGLFVALGWLEVSPSWKKTLDPEIPSNVVRILILFGIQFIAGTLFLGLFIRGLERLLWEKAETLKSLREETAVREQLQSDLLAKERLCSKLRETEQVGRIASYFGHDTKNALQIVWSALAVLRDGGVSPGQRDEALGSLEDAAKQIRTTSSQLLAFGPGYKRAPGRTNLRDILEHTARMLRGVILGNIRIELHQAADAELHIDESEVQRILINLAFNARDAMSGAGTLTLSSRELTSSERAGAPEGASYVVVEVSDTGSGIAPENLDKIFQPFFTTKGEHGTGLGLASVRQSVEACGGSIGVESTLGTGTTFMLRFPTLAQEAVGRTQPAEPKLPKSPKSAILVVEEPLMLRTLMRALKAKGFAANGTDDGPEAMALVENAQPPYSRLIVGHLDMTWIRRIVNAYHSRSPGAQTIVCTEDADEKATGIKGAQSLPKPYSIPELLSFIKD